MNNVFAHYAYGVLLDPTPGELEVLRNKIDLDTTTSEGSYFDPPEEEDQWKKSTELAQELLQHYAGVYDLDPEHVRLHLVEDDAYRGSDCGPDTLILGIGVLAFPLETEEQQATARKLKEAGADWHSWVT